MPYRSVTAAAVLACITLLVLPAPASAGVDLAAGGRAREVTIIHSTDIHGWVNGHPHNASLDADFGDFYSFVYHMQQKAAREGRDLLVFDTGDLVEGTGLSDATEVHGASTLPLVRQIPYDGLATGNHDVGRLTTTQLFESEFIPSWNGSYVAANILWRPTGRLWANSGHKEMVTPLGTKVLIFGFLFDFDQAANTTVVMRVEDVVESASFRAISGANDADLIVVVSHISPDMPEYRAIYKALRSAQPDTPLALLAGHAHQKQFKWFDDNAFCIMSGKYFETLGIINFSLPVHATATATATDQLRGLVGKGASAVLSAVGAGTRLRTGLSDFSYQWMDTGVENFMALTGTDEGSFATAGGNAIKERISELVATLRLDEVMGCSATGYGIYSPVSDPTSLYGLMVNEIVPRVVFLDDSLASTPLFFCNTESLRYDLFEGPVTLDDILTTNPFRDVFMAFRNLNGAVLKHVARLMNASPIEHSGLRGCTYQQLGNEHALPRFVWTSMGIDDGGLYDVIMPGYDSILFGKTLATLGEQSDAEEYPTDLNSTTAIGIYFKKFHPCS